MPVQHDPHAPIYVLIYDDGTTEIFQLPFRLTYKDSNGQEAVVTIDDPEELIVFMDRSDLHDLRATLVKIDARMGTVERILPRY